MPQSQDLPAFLATSIPWESRFCKTETFKLENCCDQGVLKIVLKSGVFCQYLLGVLSPALFQTSRGQRIKRERLGTRLFLEKKAILHDLKGGVIMTLHKATVELLNYVLGHKCCRAENYNNQTLLTRLIYIYFFSSFIEENERVNKITLYKHFVEQKLQKLYQ